MCFLIPSSDLDGHIPLKEGLRRWSRRIYPRLEFLDGHIPLKEGLRPGLNASQMFSEKSRWPYSIKRRIFSHRCCTEKHTAVTRLIPCNRCVFFRATSVQNPNIQQRDPLPLCYFRCQFPVFLAVFAQNKTYKSDLSLHGLPEFVENIGMEQTPFPNGFTHEPTQDLNLFLQAF